MKMVRAHPKIISEVKTSRFLSEKPEAVGGVTVVTLTSDEGFAAKNSSVLSQKHYLGMSSSNYGCAGDSINRSPQCRV